MASPESSKLAAELQAPGAGLPWFEGLIARYILFPLFCRRHTWASAGNLFQEEGRRVLAVFDSTPPDRLGERVLVRRFAGMEDSSRCWSLSMTVEHLTMVGSAIRGVISSLRKGFIPTGEARTADFKPKGEMPPDQIRAEFARFLERTAKEDETMSMSPSPSEPRFPHPWFGPMNAHQWQCLLAFHQTIHRKQAEAILKDLRDA